MTTNLRLYTAAVFAFEHVLKNAKPTAFNRKAPCEGWTGRTSTSTPSVAWRW